VSERGEGDGQHDEEEEGREEEKTTYNGASLVGRGSDVGGSEASEGENGESGLEEHLDGLVGVGGGGWERV
jgi:hypothetical protein